LSLPLFFSFLAFAIFFFYMTFLSFFGFFGLLAVLHGILDSIFKPCAFVVNGLIKGETEKTSGQFLDLIVMSH
jgi:hypothetical protein